MDPTAVQLLGAKATAALVIVYFLNWLKKSKWFPWVTYTSGRINHLIAVLLTAVGTIGIHASFNHDTHTLVISGLYWNSIGSGLWAWCQQYVLTKVGYHALQSKMAAEPDIAAKAEAKNKP